MAALNPTVRLSLVLGLLFLVLAVGMTLVLPRVRPGESDSGSSEALVAELRALRETQERTAEALSGLERVLSERLAQPRRPDTRAAVGEAPAPESFEALARSIDDLRRSLERETTATQALIRSTARRQAESLIDVRNRRTETDWPALQDLEERWRQEPEAADRSQYFLTTRDLLERYGAPTAIYRPQGGILFYYRRHPEGAPGPAWYFRLQDGMVVEFFVEDETSGDE